MRNATAMTVTPPASSDYFFLGAFTPEEELAGFACYGPTPGTDRTYDLYWIAVIRGAGVRKRNHPPE